MLQGETIGTYRLDRELGAGAMGSVWLATAPDGTTVALKIVHPHLLEQPDFRARFLREARSGQAVVHPNVVRTFECIEAQVDGRLLPALVLEFVDGRDLDALLRESRHVPEDLCRHIGRELAQALAAIHAAGIVHRDLKPGNVLVTASGEIKLTDLGLARQARGEDRLSSSGTFVGTAAYAPPEQFAGTKDLDPRSDLYSLGAMLYELATGRLPFEADGLGELVRKVLRERPARPGTLAPQLTPFFEHLVVTLLEKDPDRRFASAAELGEVFDAGESGDWWVAAAARLQSEGRRPLRRVRVARDTDLWGRDDDLAELRARWDAARRGCGGVVLLEGEAGIGKTRLAEEFLAALDEDEVQVIVAAHDPGAGGAGRTLAAALAVHLGAEDLEDALRKRLPETPLLVPAFAAFLRGDSADEATPDGTAEWMQPLGDEQVRALCVRLVRALAAERPLVFVVDDLHFATGDDLGLFRALALAVDGQPLFLVGTARPGLPARWVEELTHHDRVTRQSVGRLDLATVRAALTRQLGAGVEAESLAERIASRADGNPYFVVEILRHLRTRGHVTRSADGRWRVSDVAGEVELPATVRDLVRQRIQQLDPLDRAVLDAAACQGFDFDGRLVAEALSRPRLDVLRRLGRLEHATSLVRAAGARFTFDHHVAHEVLYDLLAAADRERLHGAIADTLERRHDAGARRPDDLDGEVCTLLAEHHLRGPQAARALPYLHPAQIHLAKRFQNARAVALAERSLADPRLLVGSDRARVLLGLCGGQGPLDRLGLRTQQERAALELVRIADELGDDRLRGRAASALGIVFQVAMRHADAERELRRALEIAQAQGDRAAEAVAIGGLANVFCNSGRFELAREFDIRFLALTRETGDRQGEATALGNLGTSLRNLGHIAEAREHFERQLALSHEIGFKPGENVASESLAIIARTTDDLTAARRFHERALALARETGDRHSEGLTTGNLGGVLSLLGRIVEARECSERHLAISRQLGNRRGEAVALVNLGPLWLSLGEPVRAREALERSLALSREIRAGVPEGFALFGLSAVADAAGDLAEALRLMEECVALRRRLGHGVGIAEALTELGDLRRRLGDADGARVALEEALLLSRDQGRPSRVALILCVLACLPGGDAAAADAARASAGPAAETVRTRFLLWKATHVRAHLDAAGRLLDESLANVPADRREAMLANVRLHREIVEARRAAGT